MVTTLSTMEFAQHTVIINWKGSVSVTDDLQHAISIALNMDIHTVYQAIHNLPWITVAEALKFRYATTSQAALSTAIKLSNQMLANCIDKSLVRYSNGYNLLKSFIHKYDTCFYGNN